MIYSLFCCCLSVVVIFVLLCVLYVMKNILSQCFLGCSLARNFPCVWSLALFFFSFSAPCFSDLIIIFELLL